MEHADHTHLPADKALILSEGLYGTRRSAKEQVVDLSLVVARDGAQFAGQGKGE
jgi:hypothetical protein